jgi:uncharacterized protein (TIGR03437 family)
MCPRDTDVRFRFTDAPGFHRLLALTLSVAFCANAQMGAGWKRIAGTTINAGLAGPASGPVAAVWYAGTGRLLVQTESSRVFETADSINWRLNTDTSVAAANPGLVSPVSLPEAGAKIQTVGNKLYAAGPSNVYVSDDNGRTWVNLTGYNNRSVIGDGFTGVAIAPDNPQEITAANRLGVWRSLDGGLSWRSLNEDLPNLSVRKLIDRRTVLLEDGTLTEMEAGSWTPVAGNDPEAALRARFGGAFTAATTSGATIYGGTADGRLLVSRDDGATWSEAPRAGTDGVTRIWVDHERPDVALAAAGAHLYRTINGGLFWDEVTGTLQSGPIHGITADRSAGVVYAATDRGVFSGSLSLNDASAAATNWKSVSSDLPAAPAWDVRLNTDNTLTVALDGYGVFEEAAPHRAVSVRVVSGADLTERPAAPGSLISVLGAKVERVNTSGASYPILAASDQSSQLQVPFEAQTGTFQLTLQGASDQWSVPLTVNDTAPAIFVDADGAPLILDAASGLVVDPKLAVYADSTVQILATGLGKVTPEWPTGVPAPVDSPPVVAGTVTAFLDGRPIEVTRATLAPAYVGYYIVELQIPAIVNRGANELRIVMNGVESNRVRLYLEPNLPAQ